MNMLQDGKQLKPELPVKTRLINTAKQYLTCCRFDDLYLEEIIIAAETDKKIFNQLFANKMALGQAVWRDFYQDTKQWFSHWGSNQLQQWTAFECFEASMYALAQTNNALYFSLMHHLTVDSHLICDDTPYSIEQLYFDDCWTEPLISLFSQVMKVDQAKNLGIETGNRIHKAAKESTAAVNKIMHELRVSLPTIYFLTHNKPLKKAS